MNDAQQYSFPVNKMTHRAKPYGVVHDEDEYFETVHASITGQTAEATFVSYNDAGSESIKVEEKYMKPMADGLKPISYQMLSDHGEKKYEMFVDPITGRVVLENFYNQQGRCLAVRSTEMPKAGNKVKSEITSTSIQNGDAPKEIALTSYKANETGEKDLIIDTELLKEFSAAELEFIQMRLQLTHKKQGNGYTPIKAAQFANV